MNHILPEEYTITLARLQDECLTRSSEELDRLFVADFGAKPEELFKEFERDKPIAAASLAQVYKAKTVDGREVAVKVKSFIYLFIGIKHVFYLSVRQMCLS